MRTIPVLDAFGLPRDGLQNAATDVVPTEAFRAPEIVEEKANWISAERICSSFATRCTSGETADSGALLSTQPTDSGQVSIANPDAVTRAHAALTKPFLEASPKQESAVLAYGPPPSCETGKKGETSMVSRKEASARTNRQPLILQSKADQLAAPSNVLGSAALAQALEAVFDSSSLHMFPFCMPEPTGSSDFFSTQPCRVLPKQVQPR